MGREEAREYESDKDSAFSRPHSSTPKGVAESLAAEASQSQGRWADPSPAGPRPSAPSEGGISLSGSFAHYQPSLDSPQRGRHSPASAGSSPVAAGPSSPVTPGKAGRPPSARSRQHQPHARAESAAAQRSPRPATAQRATPPGWPASAVTPSSATARKASPTRRISARPASRAVSHTSQAKVEASLRHSLLLAESSAPAFSRISLAQQQQRQHSGGRLDKEQSEPAVAAPVRLARAGGMSGYESYSAMRAALLSAGGPAGKPAGRPAGSARKGRSPNQRPATSQVSTTAAASSFGRSSVTGGAASAAAAAASGRAPQFARWANSQRPGTQQAAHRAAAASFGASWSAHQAAPRNLVSHGTSITLSPRS